MREEDDKREVKPSECSGTRVGLLLAGTLTTLVSGAQRWDGSRTVFLSQLNSAL